MLTKLITVNLVTSSNRINANAIKIIDKYPELHAEIIQHTNYLQGDDIPLAERLFAITIGLEYQPICAVCSKPIRFNRSSKKYNKYCSPKCAANDTTIKTAKVIKQLSNRAEITAKITHTKSLHSAEFKAASNQKRKNTIADKYNNENIWKVGIAADKRRVTNLTKYGVEYASQNDEVRAKISKNHNKALDIPELEDSRNLQRLNYDDQLTLSDIATKFNISKHAVWTRFKHNCVPVKHHYRSTPQVKVEDMILDLGIPYLSNNRSIIFPRELDIVIPSHNIAIEVNGVYWHSELNGKDRMYHLNKTRACAQVGIELLHLFDLEINSKPDIIRSMLSHKLHRSTTNIQARRCVVSNISASEAKFFCDTNHIQGGTYGSINYGLFYSGVLVATLVASRSRFESGKIEILRFCSLLMCSIVGGFGKLLAALRQNTSGTILTYSDSRFGSGNVYSRLGFNLVRDTPPGYSYFHTSDASKLFSRQQFQKHKLADKLPVVDNTKSEWENMVANGYDRIWDCGNKKWEL